MVGKSGSVPFELRFALDCWVGAPEAIVTIMVISTRPGNYKGPCCIYDTVPLGGDGGGYGRVV